MRHDSTKRSLVGVATHSALTLARPVLLNWCRFAFDSRWVYKRQLPECLRIAGRPIVTQRGIEPRFDP